MRKRLKRLSLEDLQDQKTQRLSAYLRRWRECTSCRLHEYRILGAPFAGWCGPQPILFIGEGCGTKENSEGRPFVGRSGQMLRAAILLSEHRERACFTNLVCCRPCDGLRESNRPPLPDEIKACTSHLEQLLLFLKPVRIIVVGRYTEKVLPLAVAKYMGSEGGGRAWMIEHPASLLWKKAGSAQIGRWQQAVVRAMV